MLPTTLLLATALATMLALGAMLFIRRPGDPHMRHGPAIAVAAVAVALTALSLAML